MAYNNNRIVKPFKDSGYKYAEPNLIKPNKFGFVPDPRKVISSRNNPTSSPTNLVEPNIGYVFDFYVDASYVEGTL
jgi:hypothetical protein